MRINSETPGADVYVKNELVGETPLLIRVPRDRHLWVILKGQDQEDAFELNGEYRTGRAFWGNFAFLTLAPIGMGVDLLTGASWKYHESYLFPFSFSRTAKANQAPKTLAVAPLLSDHPNISDEVGALVSTALKKKFSEVKVMPYSESLNTFNDYNMDFDSPGDESDHIESAYELKAESFYFGEIDTSSKSDKVIVRGHLKNIVQDTPDKEMNFEFDSKNISSVDEVGWKHRHSDLISWLPNSVFLDFSNSSTQLQIDNKTVQASSSGLDGALGKVADYLSAISFKNFKLPSKRPEWRFHLRFSPTASLSYAREKFNDPALSDIQFERFHADAGWGPSLNYGNNKMNFYFNLYPLLGYDVITSKDAVKNYREEAVGLNLGAEMGYIYFFREHWALRLFSRSANVNSTLWQNIIQDITKTTAQVQTASLQTSGISIGYVFSNKDLPF